MSSRLHFLRSVSCLALPLACSLALVSSAFAVIDEKVSPVQPLQTELLSPLDSSRVKVGTHVLARVVQEYKNEDCRLRAGAMLEGHVVQFTSRSKKQKISSIQVAFDHADCNNHPSAPFKFTLIALIGPYGDPPPANNSGLSEGPPLADIPANTMGVNLAPPGHAGAYLRSVESAVELNQYSVQAHHTRNLPNHILPGQVIDVPRTSLVVGAGTDGATIVNAANQDARIESRSILIMLPSSVFTVLNASNAGVTPKVPASSVNAAAAISTAPTVAALEAAAATPPEPPDETAICSDGCTLLGAMGSRVTAASKISATLPISTLGYAPRDKERALSFNHETALTYLDETHLLCTFDPHRLRTRSDDPTASVRTIRAVVINTSTHTIDRVMEWRVRGDDSYLWKLGSGQILVSTVHELRRYDSDLRPIQSVPVDGSIAWVVASPSNDHIAVAIIKRRFSNTVYEELHALDQPPDDDLEILLYDHNFKLISATIRSSQTIPPVLSDAGELRVTHLSRGRWKIVEYGWNHVSHDLTTVRSVCRPLLSVPEHGLTFITGCMESSQATWYRMVGPNGRTLLKGESPSDEVAQSADGALTGSFAIRLFKAVRPMTVDQPFNRSDLTLEEIGIYRSSNGSRLSSIATDDFVLAQNSYALSPQGDQMALAGQTSINFYEVKAQ
jgi:hypothetical protein